MEGRIVKGIGSFYYIDTGNEVIECRARGKFRNEKKKPMVGDIVDIDVEKNYILSIKDRYNEIVRPPVSNVVRTILVFSAKNPDFSLNTLDRFIVMCEEKKLEIAICISKCDLDDFAAYNIVKKIYEPLGYRAFGISRENPDSISELIEFIADDGVTILSGQSGVGKSTIIKKIIPDTATEDVETGEISRKLNRGKHTTRHVELFRIKNGYIADTPGFSSLSLNIKPEDLKYMYPDFYEFAQQCGFNTCNHVSEPRCAVKEAVEKGNINQGRYDRYVEIYNEVKK